MNQPHPDVGEWAVQDTPLDRWVQGIIRAARTEHGGPLPKYGTPEWTRLPAHLSRASILLAAECWRYETDPRVITARLTAEAAQLRLPVKQLEDQQFQHGADSHRDLWSDARKRRDLIAAEVEAEHVAWLRTPGAA